MPEENVTNVAASAAETVIKEAAKEAAKMTPGGIIVSVLAVIGGGTIVGLGAWGTYKIVKHNKKKKKNEEDFEGPEDFFEDDEYDEDSESEETK